MVKKNLAPSIELVFTDLKCRHYGKLMQKLRRISHRTRIRDEVKGAYLTSGLSFTPRVEGLIVSYAFPPFQ